ncbi:metallophosphoesterase family protein [Stomatobaculum longum]|uniref:metallophosphoesterase family protein n=1 Tax=Stomatobaculum longum TaxID=796942 RepID=UPI0028050739|nr:metallophosphoesterase [Stomatobaculum longum]
MRILAVSDTEADRFYTYYTPGRLDSYDLIISCGDLRREYLEFLVTFARCPLLYVHGNHDEALEKQAPEGCICIDGKLYVHEGIRILGLGGSFRYKPGPFQYNEAQMRGRILRLAPSLLRQRGFDILVSHAPAYGIGDLPTRTHRGFESFNRLLDKYHPRLFLHGHVHRNYGPKLPQKRAYNDTLIVNAYGYCELEL